MSDSMTNDHFRGLVARELGLPPDSSTDLTILATLQTRLAAMKQMQEIINSHSRRIEKMAEAVEAGPAVAKTDPKKLAAYLVEWLTERNGAELMDAFDNMKVIDYRNLLEELELILKHGGKPPNWVRAPRTGLVK